MSELKETERDQICEDLGWAIKELEEATEAEPGSHAIRYSLECRVKAYRMALKPSSRLADVTAGAEAALNAVYECPLVNDSFGDFHYQGNAVDNLRAARIAATVLKGEE